MSYNGWTNWATWNVALWLGNVEADYRARVAAKPRTAAEAESFTRSIYPKGTPDFETKDGAAEYENVDWEEIAASWADDYEERISP